MKKALVTGALGFVGPYLARFLISKDIKVYGTYLTEAEKETARLRCPGMELLYCDVTDKKTVLNALEKSSPDYVFHLAGFSSVRQSFQSPEKAEEINCGGTKNLLESIIQLCINPKVLVVTSSEVYGVPHSNPVCEDHPLMPVSPYGESRKKQEEICRDYDISIVISRSFNHTGPEQQAEFVCADFASQIVDIEKGKKDPIISTGDLSVIRDFSDVRDIVEGYYLALTKGKSGEIYNICSGKGVSIQDILEMLISFSDKEIKVDNDISKLRKVEIPVMIGDNSKFGKETSWKPKYDLETTLKDMLNYLRKRSD